MKKQILLVGLVAAMGLGAFLVSCSKDKDNDGLCTCTAAYTDGDETDDYDPAEEGAENCSELEDIFNDNYGDDIWSCH